MITKFLLQLRILPRWIIVVLDVLIVGLSTYLGYLLRFNFNLIEIKAFNFEFGIILNSLACLFSLLITRSYSGIVRYTGLKDGLRVLNTLLLTHVITSLANLIYHYNEGRNLVPYSVILISLLASFVLMFQYRLLIKNIFSYYRNLYSKKQNIVIFGAGQMGIMTKHLMDDDSTSAYRVCAFFEDDTNKIGKEINGTMIYGFADFESIATKYKIEELIIAIQNLSVQRKNEIVDQCLQLDLQIRTVPSLDTWVRGELSINQIKNINIDDLLERDSISLDNKLVIDQIKNQSVFITGAAGSIGSELVRQVLKYEPSQLTLVDQAESEIYELQRELIVSSSVTKVNSYVADITNEPRVRLLIARHKPQIIYHAAAYKHVPVMEDNVTEAVNCNIFGTRILSNLAVELGVEKFVMVSTDKAVNPTNVMGCSKRIAEIYVQSLNNKLRTADNHSVTQFITTRFGNVLGSNGSVIPYFKKQIDKGGPLTVTHPEITRYFMTISEACELVIEAGAMGRGGEIFLFDMGKSVKIVDLAKKMIKLSGFEPYTDIDIIFTGLRQGEKLYEELLANKEDHLPTHNKKILIAKVKQYDFESIKDQIVELVSTMEQNSDDVEFELVKKMKRIVPEFVSKSSRFESMNKEVRA